jgi:amino acid adenylation domain-containing protein
MFEWFRRSVSAHGDATALELDGLTLSYAELSDVVQRLAALLAEHGRPTRVGLLASRSLTAYVGYLAVQRLGACVVPMNPRTPAARNVLITADAAVDLTIVDDSAGYWRGEYVKQAGVPIVDLTGGRWRALLGGSTRQAPPVAEPQSEFAYISFTSGSTGRPKGVPITHRNISTFIADAIERYEPGPGCRISQTFELSFDAALNELFGAWGSGATLCVQQPRDVFNPVPFVNERRMTHWFAVPSMISFAMRERTLEPGSMPSLRCAVIGGEPFTTEQALAWRAAAPNAVLHNGYGPTELTLLCTGYILPADPGQWPRTSNGTVPIGEIYPHMEYVLLDDDLRAGDDGELCVRGPQRFPGYLDAGNNAGRFVAYEPGGRAVIYDGGGPITAAHWYRTGDRVRREDGLLVHLGRVDNQIKINGFRVELGEIEAILRRHPEVTEMVVVAVVSENGETDLHAIYTGNEVPPADFARLVAVLPLYMRPRRYERRDAIPLTTNGKVDRTRLVAEVGV